MLTAHMTEERCSSSSMIYKKVFAKWENSSLSRIQEAELQYTYSAGPIFFWMLSVIMQGIGLPNRIPTDLLIKIKIVMACRLDYFRLTE